MVFNEAVFKQKLVTAGLENDKIQVTLNNDQYVNGATRVSITYEDLNIYTSGGKFPMTCSSGMIYSYGIHRTYPPEVGWQDRIQTLTDKHRSIARHIIDAILTTLGPNDYPIVGGWIAANPVIEMFHEDHFLALGRFIPLMSWANSYHGNRGTAVWLRQHGIPKEDKSKTIDEVQRNDLYTRKKTVLNLLQEKSVEVKKEPVAAADITITTSTKVPEVTRPRDENGRFTARPVYNEKLRTGPGVYQQIRNQKI